MKRKTARRTAWLLLTCLSLAISGLAPSQAAKAGLSDSASLARKILLSKDLFHRNDLEKSLSVLQEVEAAAVRTGNRFFEAQAEFRTGLIFLKMENPRKALECLKKAQSLFEAEGEDTFLAYCISNTAIAYAMEEDYANSIASFRSLSNLYLQHSDTLNYAKTLINLSHTCLLAGDPGEALSCLRPIERLPVAQGLLAKEFRLQKALALKDSGKTREAGTLLQQVREAASGSENLEIRSIALRNMAEIHEQQGRFEQAMNEYKMLVSARDSLNLVKHNQAVYEMENRFQLEKKDRDLALARQEKEITEQKTLMAVSLLLAVILLVLSLLLRTRMLHYRSLAEKNLLDEELKKGKEILSRLHIQGKEAALLLEQLQDNIAELKKSKSANQEVYFPLNSTLDQIQRLMKTWAFVVDEKNSDFMLSLEKAYPGLTPAEKKTCMLLYIDLSTKDIAQTFNISEKSVNNTRSRIRRKLRVPAEMPLSEFLRQNTRS